MERPVAAPGPDHETRRAFVLLCAMGLLGRLSYEMLRTPVTSLYARHIGAPTALIGLLVSAVTLTGIFVKLPAGALSDRFGARRLMGLGLVVKFTAPFLYLLAATWPILLAVRLYHGLSTALYAPPASAEAARLFPQQRGRRLGFYGAAENAGVALGPLLGAALLAHGGFRLAFVVSGIIGVMAFLPVLRYRPPAGPPAEATGTAAVVTTLKNAVVQIARDPVIRVAGLVEATLYAAVGTLQAFLPLYGLGVHLSVMAIGVILAGQGVASILLRPITGSLGDRYGRTRLIAAGLVACAIAMTILPHLGSLATLLPFAILFGAGTAAVTPSTTALISERAKQGSLGTAMGVFGSLWDVGHAGGPLLSGLLVAGFGYVRAFATVAAVLLLVLGVFVWHSRKEQTG